MCPSIHHSRRRGLGLRGGCAVTGSWLVGAFLLTTDTPSPRPSATPLPRSTREGGRGGGSLTQTHSHAHQFRTDHAGGASLIPSNRPAYHDLRSTRHAWPWISSAAASAAASCTATVSLPTNG